MSYLSWDSLWETHQREHLREISRDRYYKQRRRIPRGDRILGPEWDTGEESQNLHHLEAFGCTTVWIEYLVGGQEFALLFAIIIITIITTTPNNLQTHSRAGEPPPLPPAWRCP